MVANLNGQKMSFETERVAVAVTGTEYALAFTVTKHFTLSLD